MLDVSKIVKENRGDKYEHNVRKKELEIINSV